MKELLLELRAYHEKEMAKHIDEFMSKEKHAEIYRVYERHPSSALTQLDALVNWYSRNMERVRTIDMLIAEVTKWEEEQPEKDG